MLGVVVILVAGLALAQSGRFIIITFNLGKERNVFFNDVLNTFYLRLRTILIVRKETRCRHIGYSFRLTARVLLYAHSTVRIAHTTAFVIPVVEHWMEREIAQWVHPMEDRFEEPSHYERTLLPRSYISLHI